MSKLSIFEKNAYISIVIKDNGIWTHLAYTDHNARREYILSDYTDLNSLRYRLDDNIFTKEFWFEYFNNLEKIFSWNIVDKNSLAIFTFRKFKNEGDGITGIRVVIDDNQHFFDKIFQSVRDFSNDLSLRVINDEYMQNLIESLADRLGYDDLMYIDMDLYDFSLFRTTNIYQKDGSVKKLFSKSKLGWNSDLAVIDSINDKRFEAFLTTDLSERELTNYWSNFVLDRPLDISKEQNLLDLVRAYTTIQNFSILRDNKQKLQQFGNIYQKTAMIISGYIPNILGKYTTLLALTDGLELYGNIDCFFDSELRMVSFGKSYAYGINSTDIILTKKDVIPSITKLLIPSSVNGANKIIFTGYAESVEIPRTEFFVLSPQFSMISLPAHQEKLIVNGSWRNGAKMNDMKNEISFISTPQSCYYDSILIDARPRPIIYGPDAYSNKLKIQQWKDDNKA